MRRIAIGFWNDHFWHQRYWAERYFSHRVTRPTRAGSYWPVHYWRGL
jgi:hypothetical protein